jgi:UDPglucose 6-dehydrogenase
MADITTYIIGETAMDIAIIGYGIVGKATHHSFLADCTDITIYDIDDPYQPANRQHDLIFVCLPTNDQSDVDCLKSLCLQILENDLDAVVCIRSSVPIGLVSQDLKQYSQRVIYFPEFLRERRWLQDALLGTWIIGCDASLHDVMDKFCTNKQAVYVTLVEAEIIKMMANSWAAMNVVFANHVYDISVKLGARYHVIENAHDQVRHRDQSYLRVTPSLRGFGGKCLPKDLEFFIRSFEQAGLTQTLFSSVQNDNQQWPVTVRNDP